MTDPTLPPMGDFAPVLGKLDLSKMMPEAIEAAFPKQTPEQLAAYETAATQIQASINSNLAASAKIANTVSILNSLATSLQLILTIA